VLRPSKGVNDSLLAYTIVPSPSCCWSRLISPEFAEFSPDLLTVSATLARCRGDGDVGETGGSKRVWSCNCRHQTSLQTLNHQPAVSWGNDPEELNLHFFFVQPLQPTRIRYSGRSDDILNERLGKHRFVFSNRNSSCLGSVL
jgi:hypothetical protein